MIKRLAALAGAAALALVGTVTVTAPAAHAANAPNGYPYCANGSASDPDGDGWGWENNQSCVVRGGKADTGGSGGSGGSSSGGSGGSTLTCPSGMSCGSYTVSGLGSRKQQVRNAGGNVLDLAVAMLETDTMTSNYAYGDNKSGDAANFGIFKQNWMMLRAACSRFQGQSASQWNNGAALNSDLSSDVSCLHQSQNHYGTNTWFAGHRNGSSGLNNPNTTDINNYRNAVYWIRDQLNSNSANLSNDTRYWVNVPAI
ncbi:carbohydrate-binding domain-containing protein [Peterkaempfera bronchialis]|uniref:carbohydrate-binding domain-containing protein n=1 Tax=Peterkaempfera bronchialis TaxID=2126346 RepID=UPI001E42C90F|nr:carbohydrate-binding domain-containing protein [Peterkaempfera bronchialis]